MNRFSYLAAISSVLAADFESSQTLVEQGLEDMANIQTFRTTDVTAAVSSGGWYKMAGTYAAAEHVDAAKCMDVTLKLVKDEYFLIEVNQLVEAIAVVASGNDGTFAAPKFTTSDVANAADINAADKIVGTIAGTTLANASDFVRNYKYPTYRVKATGDNTAADGTSGYFGLVAKKVGATDYYCKTWKTTVTTTARTTSLAQTSQALLKNDASNRLKASTVTDLACTGTKCTATDPATEGKWLDSINDFGKKLQSEYFIAGAPLDGVTASSVKQAAPFAIAATCKTGGSTLNALLNPGHVDTGTTAINTGTGNYNARTYMVPNDATAGQKYYSCIVLDTVKTGTTTTVEKSYTAVQVEVTRPAFWQYNVEDTKASTRMLANQGTVNAGLPKALEWGFTATALSGATAISATTELGTSSNSIQMATDISAIANTVWESGSAEKIDTQAVKARAGEYLFFTRAAANGKALVNFWTGQAGMGRFNLPTESATFKHLELWSFAQPGNKYTATDAQPSVVLRVPTAAITGSAKYYAGFQIADNAANTAVKFYTTSLQVEVIARRFGTADKFKESLVQPNFQTVTALTEPPLASGASQSITTDPTSSTSTWLTTDPTGKKSIWGNGAVTDAIPGQVVAFSLPNKCRIDDVYTTPNTNWITTTAVPTPALTERGSYQGEAGTTTNPGMISFMVPTDADETAAATKKYYAGLKITNDSTVQYLAVSVALKTGAKADNIKSDGINTLFTGSAGSADKIVTLKQVEAAHSGAAGTYSATAPNNADKWWTTPKHILTDGLEMMDGAKAVIAFDANVGLKDTTATTGADALTDTGRYAHIPADGFLTQTAAGATTSSGSNTATEWSTWPAVEVQMPLTQVIDFDYTDKYLYRTYEMVLGGNAKTIGQKYYGAIRAKVLSPEIWDSKTAFDAALPLSAKTYTQGKVTWTAGVATAPAAASGATPATAWAANTAAPATGASTNNQITRNVENGNSFVIAIDHDLGTVTWQPTAVPTGKALERREQLTCTFAKVGTTGGDCIPSWSFRMPLAANTGDKYYAAFKAVVATASNDLAAGTYWVSIEGTVTAPIRHYATWSDMTARTAVKWSFKNLDTQTKVDDALTITGAGSTSTKMDSTKTASEWQGFNNQWWLSKASTDIAAGWQESATNVLAANVDAGAEACFDFSEFTAGVTLVTPAVVSGGTDYTAITGSQPAIAAQVTPNQLKATAADVGVNAWCFTAPASGFGYVIAKTGDWYLPIKISTSARERAFPTVAAFTADAGNRWSGSVHRVYSDLAKQWADTPAGTTKKINTDFLIDEVAVKKSPADGAAAEDAVDVGAFAVIITNAGFTKCTEYAEASMEDTADTPAALARPTKWLTSFGSVHSATDFSRVGNSQWAFSWQVPSDATATDTYYLGLRCEGNGDYSAMWKVSITDAPTFTATSADLKVAPGNQKKAFTKFEDDTEGKWVGAGALGVGTATQPAIPDPRWDTITASFEVEAGNGFSVEISKTGVTAEVVAEADLNDEYGKPLNLEARSLILFGEAAKLTASTAGPPVTPAVWSALPAATATEFPAYSWQVPSGAEVGEVHYAAVRAVDGTKKYVALFECVVKATPAPAPEPVEEESGVMGAVITTALVTAAIAAALFFFVL